MSPAKENEREGDMPPPLPLSQVTTQGWNQCGGSGSALILVDAILIQGGKNDPQKKKKVNNFLF